MPAAAVIPAPVAYSKIVAVKKLVVGFLVVVPGRPQSSNGRVCTRLLLPSFQRKAASLRSYLDLLL